ncbi:alpha/beta hydrolase [Brevundimonas sp.]|uniref:alpha/beta hydrolase n=1 Tax=Brevundimonas sp. TaxID=1871086 RepID=UPI002899BC61|nr:alpha/beta hydrolase [Brevundimonas sp.]
MAKLPRLPVRNAGVLAVAVFTLQFVSPASGKASAPDAVSGLRVEVSANEMLGRGRLILFVRRATNPAATAVDGNAFERDGLQLAARNVSFSVPRTVVVDDAADAWPGPLSSLAPGDYVVQAVFDRDFNYAYSGRGPGDVLSRVATVRIGETTSALSLELTDVIPELAPWHGPWGPVAPPEELAFIQQNTRPLTVPSERLGRFWGRPISLNGLVVTPLDYDQTQDRLPVVYFTHGFGGGMASLQDTAAGLVRQMKAGVLPRLIWVLLDQSGPMGTHEFADSLNNGPWGAALTQELIPVIDDRFRTQRRRNARFVMGHSSGGWAALWLQLEYADIFGGAWATSPDYSDFSNFGGVDLTAPGGRMKGLNFARAEAVLGAYGGQNTSFEAVWSPRGSDGMPAPLFDRETGLVDAQVATWWRDHWDLTEKVRREWVNNAAYLDGAIHVVVGENDEFALDDSARDLERAITSVSGRASFRYLPGKGHFDLYVEGDERAALRRVMAWEMADHAQRHP